MFSYVMVLPYGRKLGYYTSKFFYAPWLAWGGALAQLELTVT